MRAHGVKQKRSVCVRACAPIMNMYGSFCGRYVRVLFAPRGSCVRARSKDAALFPLHSPCYTYAHMCVFSPSSYLALSLSVPLSLFIPAYVDYATVSSASYSQLRFLFSLRCMGSRRGAIECA